MVGEIWILLGSARLHFMKGSADELLLRNKSSACGYTSRGANVTVQCCWKDFCALFPIPGFSHTVLRKVACSCTSSVFYWTQSWIILTYKTSRKLLLMKKDYDQEASFLPSEVSCWISRLWSWSCGLCHITPRPEANCRDHAAPCSIIQGRPARKRKATDGFWCHSGLCWNVT